eukprot:GEMP01051003.1.p2 GENE.GEMP01051003.1~~GEMP01051003.1.p2  ORF type:complete len:103 (-),score=3.99 GEMP01051003.1:118-426(-)
MHKRFCARASPTYSYGYVTIIFKMFLVLPPASVPPEARLPVCRAGFFSTKSRRCPERAGRPNQNNTCPRVKTGRFVSFMFGNLFLHLYVTVEEQESMSAIVG